jgi:hypothetical protein
MIELRALCTNVQITGNTFVDPLGGRPAAIRFVAGCIPTNINITGNTANFTASVSKGISVDNSVSLTHVNVQNNIFNAYWSIFCGTGVSWLGFLLNNTLIGVNATYYDADEGTPTNGTPSTIDANIRWQRRNLAGDGVEDTNIVS